MVETVEYEMINPPGNATTFLTGIGFTTWQRDPLEGAGLAVSYHSKERPAPLEIDPYLATHMHERGTHVVFLGMSHDLFIRKAPAAQESNRHN